MVRSTVAHLFLMLHFESLWVNASHHDSITNEDEYEATKYDWSADSLYSAVPHEFTSIPFPVKALKILVHDLRSGGESAVINGQGEEFDVDSDDGVSFLTSSFAVARA